jgi:outer membrane protein OmpA-like peptidoglycan-associated protein/tetratricopeptide (TPR) repeat protein
MKIFLPFKPKQMPVCKTNSAMKIKTTTRFLILLVACTGWMQSQSQQAKSPVQLADQYFAAGEYYTAAHLYEQFLNAHKKQKTSGFPLNAKGKRATVTNKDVSRTDILFKQAESYRLANYWQEAAASYKECAEKDPSQHADALYWYAVCERSLGHYDTARETLKQFLRKESLKQYLSSADKNNQYKEAAEKELQTLAYIQQQLARPDSVLINIQKLNVPNSGEKGAFAPVHISGNQFLISSTQTDSVRVNGVNPYHSRLFYATLNNSSLEEMVPVTISATDPLNNQGAASISANGNYLYFSQWKKENGHTASSIYFSVKQAGGWSVPTLLPSVNIDGHNSKQPFCSTDGKYLFFASDRPGGSGRFDIWYAPLKKDGTTGEPVNAGPAINSSSDEQAPFYHNSSTTLVFSSNGRTGMGGYDLFAAKGGEATWKSSENLGHPVNSSRDDIYFFAPEKTALLSNAIFSSDRGEGCCLETYRISKAPKGKRLTGLLRNCKDNNAPVGNAEVILKDASGKIWKATTDADGKYVFDLKNDTYQDLTLTVNKELYLEKTSSFKVESIDESDLLTDKLTNADVCIEKKPEPEPEPILVIKAENVVTVYFDFDKSILKPAAVDKLDSIYTEMVEYPAATIQISGYTDGLGSDEYNAILSDKRARACADYLIQKGIEAGRVSFVSFGACCPVEMEIINGRDNPDGRSLNRRALINVKKD